MAIDWNLAQRPGGFENALAQGLQFGSQLAERRQQGEQRNALAAYAASPNDQTFGALLPHLTPQAAMEAIGNRGEAANAARVGNLTRLGAQGGEGSEDAILELWGVDRDAAAALDTRARARATEGFNFIGQAALDIDRLPEEQRPAAWDAAIDQGVQMGYGGLSQYRGQYSPQSLQGVVARAGQMQTLLNNRNPSYMAIPEGGTLVDTRNPQAVQAFGSQGGAPQGYGDGSGLTGTGIPSGSPLSQAAPQAGPVPAPPPGFVIDGGPQAMNAPAAAPETLTRQEVDSLRANFPPDDIDRLIRAGRIVVRN